MQITRYLTFEMAYQNRKRNYRNRRERLSLHQRNFRLIFLFGLLALMLLVLFRFEKIWAWLSTYFY